MSPFEIYVLGIILYGIFAVYVVGNNSPKGPLPVKLALLEAAACIVAVVVGALLWPIFLASNIYHTLRQ